MSEERLDRIESKIDSEVKEAAMFRGRLDQFMANTDSYIRAVSTNQKDTSRKLEEHEKDTGAHGANVHKEIVAMAGGGVGFLAALVELWHRFVPPGHKP